MMDDQLTAIVTGAAGGIGSATTRLLRDAGWVVVAVDRSEPPDHANQFGLSGDVTTEATWEAATEIATTAGRLGAVVNAAGVQGRGALLGDLSLSEFRAVMSVNVESAFLGTRAGLSTMASTGGSIVNIASVAGTRGVPLYGAYSASKHAVVGLTRTAAAEGGRHKVRCNALCPGPTATSMMTSVTEAINVDDPGEAQRRMERANPMKRFAQPAEIADAIAWLVSPAATYINGAVLTIDGGLTAT